MENTSHYGCEVLGSTPSTPEVLPIPGYSNYSLINRESVLNIKTNKIVTKGKWTGTATGFYFKLKSDEGKWSSVSLSKILLLACHPKPPKGYRKVPSLENFYISSEGVPWRISSNKLIEMVPNTSIHHSGYVQVYNGKTMVFIHQLVAEAWIDPDYKTKGLIVLHLDNDKTNNSVYNLKVGTHSENLIQAYEDGLR